MATNPRTHRTLGSVAVVALLALAVVPALAATASAAPVAAGAAPAGGSGGWAYGGHASLGVYLHDGGLTYSLNASAESDVIYHATNVTANITELSANRTVVLSLTESITGANASGTYTFKLAEDDQAYANVTNAAQVSLEDGSTVAALGLINASVHADVTLAAALQVSYAGAHMSDYLNASGWAHGAVSLSPALGLIPLNLTDVTGWEASALASGSAAWNISWAWVDHGWNGTSGAKSGYISGSWSTSTEVTVLGAIGPVYPHWSDHRVRAGVGLTLSGPFDLYGGIILVPHGFDLLDGQSHAYAGAGLSTGAITSSYLYVNAGRLAAPSMTAASMTTGSSGTIAAVTPEGTSFPAASGSPTVYEQPESVATAQRQASCAQYDLDCGGKAAGLGPVVVALAIAGVAAVVAVALIASRRRNPPAASRSDTTLAATPYVAPPTPPTGLGPQGPLGPAP